MEQMGWDRVRATCVWRWMDLKIQEEWVVCCGPLKPGRSKCTKNIKYLLARSRCPKSDVLLVYRHFALRSLNISAKVWCDDHCKFSVWLEHTSSASWKGGRVDVRELGSIADVTFSLVFFYSIIEGGYNGAASFNMCVLFDEHSMDPSLDRCTTTTRLVFSWFKYPRWGCDLVVTGSLIYQVASSHIDAVQCKILRLILP